MQLCQQRAAKYFVAGRFVVNTRTVKEIGQMGQQFGPEKEAQPAFRTIGPHTIDRVGYTLFERTQQLGVILGIVFEVGILNQNIFAVCVGKGGANGRSFAIVVFVENNGNVISWRKGLQFFAGAVDRAVVNKNDFFFYRRGLDRAQ